MPSAIKRFGVRQVRGWRVVGEEERRLGRRHRAADCRQRRAEERWQPAAAGRQMPAARLTRWAQRPQLVQGVGRSARTSRISRQSGCPGRDRPRGAPRPGLTCSCRRGQQSCGAAVAGAQLGRWVSSLSPRERAQAGHFCPAYASRNPCSFMNHKQGSGGWALLASARSLSAESGNRSGAGAKAAARRTFSSGE